MFHQIESETANGAWMDAVALLRSRKGELQANPLGTGSRELHHVTFSVTDPRQRWVFARRPAINPAFALAEVVWIVCGRNDATFLTHWNRELPKFSGDDANLHGAYGFRLRRHFGLDQLSTVARALSSSPFSRQAVLQIWDARCDLPGADGKPVAQDIPCNVHSSLKILDGRLDWLQIIRSNDLFLGVPYNLIQWTTLQEILAGWIGVPVGSYNQISDSLHIYNRNWDSLAFVDSDAYATNSDSLAVPIDESETSFRILERCLDRISTERKSVIPDLLRKTELIQSFHNWLLLFCAEEYRREGDAPSALSMIAECTNPALVLAWHRWNARFRKGSADERQRG